MPATWPNREAARSVMARPHDWAVIQTGQPADAGPVLLMLHGAGGSGHSFRSLIPLLADRFHLVVPDLPGQGFSRAGNKGRLGLDAMAEDLWRLCDTLKITPTVILGHSAGAAIALRMAELRPVAGVIGINAAVSAFEGAAGVLFPLLARVLAVTPFVPSFVSRLWGNAATVRRLLQSTGSAPDAAGLEQYLTLVRDRDHVEGTLAMMAQWQGLEGVLARLPQTAVPVLLIATTGDKAVPARVSREAAARIPGAAYVELPRLGHLAHEEAAEKVMVPVKDWLARLARTPA